MAFGLIGGLSIKRFLDFFSAVLLLICLSPFWVLLLILCLKKIGKPIFFRQERTGINGKIFKIYKLRTMTNAKDANGKLLPDAERLTSFGRFLRATSLDEIPQLLNVLKGDMSLVGPRPLLPRYLPLYSPEQMRRHYVKPGITGWAQIRGRNAISWSEKFKLDEWYVDNWSFCLDIKILILTVMEVVFKHSGISARGHETMPEFTGNEKIKDD